MLENTEYSCENTIATWDPTGLRDYAQEIIDMCDPFYCEPLPKKLVRRSFVFHPSFMDTYFDLKAIDPKLAEQFIEAVMKFGVDDEKEEFKNPVLRTALYGPYATISSAYIKYVARKNETYRKEIHRRELEARQKSEEDRKRRNERRRKYREYERRMRL